MEKEIFNKLLSKDPTPGVQNRVSWIKSKTVLIPGWVLDQRDDIVIGTGNLGKELLKRGFTKQILYDILVLGLVNIDDRPKCPVCGRPAKFKRFSSGYQTLCGSKSCVSKYVKNEMNALWNDNDYRDIQSNSHIKWASIPENKEKMRKIGFSLWEDEEYRDKQVNSHKEWASDKQNREQMRNCSLLLWKDEKYRNKQIQSHKEWAINNPDKIGPRGQSKHGTIGCNKSIKGELKFDSSWEEEFIKYCINSNMVVSIERSPYIIPYIIDGATKNYFPDFEVKLINGVILMLEIKANWMLDLDNATKLKISAGRNFVKNENSITDYLLLTEDNLFDNYPSQKSFSYQKIDKELIKYL